MSLSVVLAHVSTQQNSSSVTFSDMMTPELYQQLRKSLEQSHIHRPRTPPPPSPPLNRTSSGLRRGHHSTWGGEQGPYPFGEETPATVDGSEDSDLLRIPAKGRSTEQRPPLRHPAVRSALATDLSNLPKRRSSMALDTLSADVDKNSPSERRKPSPAGSSGNLNLAGSMARR